LSVAGPATAFSYVLETVLAKYIPKEHIGLAALVRRFAGWLWSAADCNLGLLMSDESRQLVW
jgi:hypothetical protein